MKIHAPSLDPFGEQPSHSAGQQPAPPDRLATGQKNRDKAGLPNSIQQYRDIFEIALDGLVVNDLETGLVLEANPAFCRMHGYDNMAGMHPSVFIHPNSHGLFSEYVETIRAGLEYRARAQDVRSDGTVFDVEVLGRIMSYHGKPAMLGVVRDVSDQVRAYQMLEERVAERTSEIQRRNEVAEGMRELLAVVNSRQSLQEILDYLVAQSRRLLGSDASAVFMPIEESGGQLLGIRASDGLTPEHATVRMPFGVSSTGIAFIRRKAVVVSDLPAALPPEQGKTIELELDERPTHIKVVRLPSLLENPEREPGSMQIAGMRSFAKRFGAFLSVPLAVEDEAFGTMSLYYFKTQAFSEYDIALATTFARQAALAIENARLREQARHAAAVEERQRLARELHDAVTQTLFSASLISEVIPDLWDTNPTEAKRRLEQLRRLTRGALAEMRILLVELRPSALTEMPLSGLLSQLIEAASGTMHAEIGLSVEGECRSALTPDAQIAFYRVAQEALNNISKHAQASHVSLTLRCQRNDEVRLVIRDDGRGFDQAAIPAGHLGVGIMAERAAAVCADLQVTSSPGNGTVVDIRWQPIGDSGE